MSLEAVKQYFKEQDMESRVIEFQQSSATVEEAAAAIGCEPRQIAKTMSFYVDDAPILIVLAGDPCSRKWPKCRRFDSGVAGEVFGLYGVD